MATAAACCCLIQSSQRCSEACRIRVVLSLLRLSAFRPGDRSWMVRWSSASSIEPSMAGRRSVRWRAERCTARPKKHGSDDCHCHCLCPLAASTSALVSARRCSWCRCLAAALALAPLNDIVRLQRSASSFRPAGPPQSSPSHVPKCARRFSSYPPSKPADFDGVRFNLTLILSITDTKRQIWLTQGWT